MLLQYYRRTFDPHGTLEAHTFEVKTAAADLMPALHQTLAHGRFADKVYLVAPHSARWTEEVIAQAQAFGVGVIRFEEVSNFSTFDVVCMPASTRPNPDLRDKFLAAALSREGRIEDVKRWMRS
jgi:hypothetical protein